MNPHIADGIDQPIERGIPRGAMRDDFAEERVVQGGHDVALAEAVIDTQAVVLLRPSHEIERA